MDDQCARFKGKNDDELAKPYDCWFQKDVLSADYQKPKGKRFGLDSPQWWLISAPLIKEGNELPKVPIPLSTLETENGEGQRSMMDDGGIDGEASMARNNEKFNFPDLIVDIEDSEQDLRGLTEPPNYSNLGIDLPRMETSDLCAQEWGCALDGQGSTSPHVPHLFGVLMVNDSTSFGMNVRHSQHISGDVSAHNYLVNGEISLGGPTNAS